MDKNCELSIGLENRREDDPLAAVIDEPLGMLGHLRAALHDVPGLRRLSLETGEQMGVRVAREGDDGLGLGKGWALGLGDVEHRHQHEGSDRRGLLSGRLVALAPDRGSPDPERSLTGRPVVAAGVDTLDEFALAYFTAKAPVLAPDTIRNRDEDYCARIAPVLGAMPLTEITRERVELWLAELVKRASSRRMVVQTVGTLRVILGTAAEWERIPSNPASRLTLPAPETGTEQAVERVLDAAQLERLFAAAGTLRTETMLRVAGEAGLRRGEIAGLKWPDVDLAGRRLAVRRSIVQERVSADSPMRKIERTTKGRRARKVAITEALAARLGEWYASAVVAGGATADGFVWPGRDGGPMHDRSLARALERALLRAGLVAHNQNG